MCCQIKSFHRQQLACKQKKLIKYKHTPRHGPMAWVYAFWLLWDINIGTLCFADFNFWVDHFIVLNSNISRIYSSRISCFTFQKCHVILFSKFWHNIYLFDPFLDDKNFTLNIYILSQIKFFLAGLDINQILMK